MGIDDTGHHACEYGAEAPEAKPGLVWEGTTFRAGARSVLRSLESGSLAGNFSIYVQQKDAYGEVRIGFAFKKCCDAASSVRGEFPSGYLLVMVSGAVSGWFFWARVALEYN